MLVAMKNVWYKQYEASFVCTYKVDPLLN
jgi:hypothetical protein